MDPLTQGALGGAIAVAGFRQKLGRRSVLFAAAAAMSPDLDVVVGLWGDEWTTLAAHRGSSHSLLVLPFLAPLAGWVGWRFFDPGRPSESSSYGWGDARSRSWAWLAFWALVTHPLLDVFTTYGTQLLAPFSRTRFAWDAVAIIDPLFTLPLLAAVALAYVGRIPVETLRRVGIGALSFCIAYLAWGLWVSAEARQAMREELARAGLAAEHVRASPVFFFPPLRRVSAHDGEGRFWSGAISAWNTGPVELTPAVSAHSPEIDAVLETRGGRTFAWFADGWVRAEFDPAERAVYLFDERYGLITRPEFTPFVAVAELEGGVSTEVEGEGKSQGTVRFHQGGSPFDDETEPGEAIRAELAAGWRLLLGR